MTYKPGDMIIFDNYTGYMVAQVLVVDPYGHNPNDYLVRAFPPNLQTVDGRLHESRILGLAGPLAKILYL